MHPGTPGSGFVLDAVSGAFPGSVHRTLTPDGEFDGREERATR